MYKNPSLIREFFFLDEFDWKIIIFEKYIANYNLFCVKLNIK